MNSLQEHFKRELDIMRKSVEEGDQLVVEPFVDAINELLGVFADQGHSGASAPFVSSVLTKTIQAVLGFQVLSPLTGEDNEWNDISEMAERPLWQNIRDSGIFKDGEGNCTYNTSIVWVGDQEYDRFTGTVQGYSSSNYIKEFPFMPKTFYVEVVREPYDENNPLHKKDEAVETQEGNVVYSIKDLKQLEEVFNYYNLRTK